MRRRRPLLEGSFEDLRAVDFALRVWRDAELWVRLEHVSSGQLGAEAEETALQPRPPSRSSSYSVASRTGLSARGAARLPTPEVCCDTRLTVPSTHRMLVVSTPQPASIPSSEAGSELAGSDDVECAASSGQSSERKPLTPSHRGKRSSVISRTTNKLSKAANMSFLRSAPRIRASSSLPDDGPHQVEPRKVRCASACRCYRAFCQSVCFWRTFPWVLAYSLAAFCHLQTLFVTMRVFAEFEDPIAMGVVWLQAIGISLAIGWLLQDPVIIFVRNNLSCTKAIIRSKKYQVIEKYVVQPFRLAVNQSVNYLIHLCGG